LTIWKQISVAEQPGREERQAVQAGIFLVDKEETPGQ
jgi:hypothetical protein